jgi:hypothetical protein
MKLQTYTENHTEILYIKKFSPLSLVDFSLSIQCKLRILGLIRAQIFILLRIPRIDAKESITPAYVAWRAGTTTLFLLGC